ncbi:hypothetical protein ACPF4H_001759 [Vibrio cholerae]|nr:hypothetical protein [Vibrio cholerae]
MDISLLSSIPTDSLYKFMSISGLIILVCSLSIPFYFRNNYQIQVYEFRKVHDLTGLKMSILIERILKGLSLGDGVYKEFYTNHRHLSPIEFFYKYQAWFKTTWPEMDPEGLKSLYNELGDDFNEIIYQVRKEQIENECEIKKIELLSSQLSMLLFVQVLGTFIGLFLAMAGFILWYTKIQIYVDASVIGV